MPRLRQPVLSRKVICFILRLLHRLLASRSLGQGFSVTNTNARAGGGFDNLRGVERRRTVRSSLVEEPPSLCLADEADSIWSTEDFYTVHDANQDLRKENEALVTRIRELDITVTEQAHGVQRFKDRCHSSDVDCAAAMRYVAQERERMKDGLTVYNAELAKLRQYLEEHDRVTATVKARRGTDTSVFAPAFTVMSRAANSSKLTATAERFLEPGFTAVGAQKAWCQMLNVSLLESAPKDHMSPLNFAFLALIYNVHSVRRPWRVLFDRMPDEPLTFEFGKLVQGGNKKIDLCVALWERRHWLKVSALDNAIRKFKEGSDPLDPFTHVILGLWHDINRMRNNRADLLQVLLESSYLQYSTEVLEWAAATKDWFREMRAVISGIVVNLSLAGADLVAPWINKVSAATGVTKSSPAEAAKKSSVGAENAPPGPAETAKALDEDSFSFAPVETATSKPDSAVTESSATPFGVEVPAHDAEEPPSDIVLAPYEMLVQIATSER
ncbi:hypothetical protein PHMEG_00024540 [Phytophthora megakarya]|uniref:Uncharacterized protein n=1 Tax=Phytophthora megakarya TaxID=4795 RepID=A0A225VEF0_9STRA|nr:hypothetical protein PHMEG_00024540 [Phytophthora megakarya]